MKRNLPSYYHDHQKHLSKPTIQSRAHFLPFTTRFICSLSRRHEHQAKPHRMIKQLLQLLRPVQWSVYRIVTVKRDCMALPNATARYSVGGIITV